MILILVVHQLAIDVRIFHQMFGVVSGQEARIFSAFEWRDLPGRFAVVGLHFGHALDNKFLADFVGPLILLHYGCAEPSLVDLGGHPQGFHGFEFFDAAARLNIFGDDFVDSLSAGPWQKERRAEEHHGGSNFSSLHGAEDFSLKLVPSADMTNQESTNDQLNSKRNPHSTRGPGSTTSVTYFNPDETEARQSRHGHCSAQCCRPGSVGRDQGT